MTWQAVGLFESFRTSGQPGNITRLLACSEEQLLHYDGLDVGPTFVHHNMRFGHALIDEVGYPSYNKPASVMFWLEQVDVREEFIALLDADMLLRAPLDPVRLGAARGVVVSAEYSYLVGTDTFNQTHDHAFARRFVDPHELPLMVRCGGFHIFHREDIRRIAPLWVEYTRRVRAFARAEPETYFSESFLNWHQTDVGAGQREVYRRQGLWQAEMYGYIFGAARAGVSHVVRRDTMLYPGYSPLGGLLPAILHYGADYTLAHEDVPPLQHATVAATPLTPGLDLEAESTRLADGWPGGSETSPTPTPPPPPVYFNKMNQVHLDLYAQLRQPWCQGGTSAFTSAADLAASGSLAQVFFAQPPPPYRRDGSPRSKRDLLCIEHLQMLNEAFCRFYAARCSNHTTWTCDSNRAMIQAAMGECVDADPLCQAHAASGECTANPVWMYAQCPLACGICAAMDEGMQALELQRVIGVFDLVGPLAAAPSEP